MAEEFEIIRANLLPAAGTITDNDMIIIAQGGKIKRALPSAMKGKQGNPGLNAFLGVDDRYILWKQGANGAWQNLLEIEKIRGSKGEKPLFRKVGGTLQMKYEGEPDTAYVNIFDREELKMKFSDLTVEEVDILKLHFSDLSEADIKELQKPAQDAADELNKVKVAFEEFSNTTILAESNRVKAEEQRVLIEELRVEAETARASAETLREDAEELRDQSETERNEAEQERILAETMRSDKEDDRIVKEQLRVNAEKKRQENEEIRQAQEEARQADTASAIRKTEDATAAAKLSTALMDEMNAHPMKPQEGLWYRWNPETDAYESTGIQAKGDPGQSFRILGQYDTLDELIAAIPDGTGIDGVYAVGTSDPFNYYAWIYKDDKWQWVDQGQLRGAEGKSAYEVWLKDPDNAGKTEQDYLDYLRQPATEAAALADAATQLATDAAATADSKAALAVTATEAANKAATDADDAARLAEEKTALAVAATDNADQATALANAAAKKAEDAAASIITPDIDHAPGEDDLTYQVGDVSHSYHPGDECRYYDPELEEYIFYKLHDITDKGKALWQEAGSGGTFKGETVVVKVSSTLGENDMNLVGIILTIKIGVEETMKPIGGVPLAIQVPRGKECTVTPPPVAGYKTPDPVSFTAGTEGREVAFVYEAINYVAFNILNNVPENIEVTDTGGLIDSLIGEASKRYLMKQTEFGKKATLLSENDSSQYADGLPVEQDGSAGDMMTRLPDMFYEINRDTEGVRRIAVAKENVDGKMKAFAGGWVGVMKASVADGKMYSVPNVVPALGLSYAEYKKAAQARGVHFELVGYDQHCQIAFLLYAKYKTRNLQLVLGAGGAHYNSNNLTGQTLFLGNRDTTKEVAKYVSGLGLEGVFGCCYEYVDRAYKLGTGYHFQNGDPGGTERIVETGAEVHGWVSHMLFEESDTFDLIPTGTGASSTTGYTDFFESAHSMWLPLYPARSCFSVKDGPYQDDGIAYLQFFNTENLTTGRYGSRLAYRGDDIEVVDAETYRSLAIIKT